MRGRIDRNERLPDVKLAYLEGESLRVKGAHELFAGKRAIIIGTPGAFTPICSNVHLPGFIESAPSLHASGFDLIACLAPNDPWTLATFAGSIDKEGRVRFLSDGNLEFGRSCGLLNEFADLFLGTRLMRFSLIVNNCVVEKVAIEASVLNVSCSSAQACLTAQKAA